MFVSVFLSRRRASWRLAAVFLPFQPDSKEVERVGARYAPRGFSTVGQASVSTLCFNFLQSTSTDDPLICLCVAAPGAGLNMWRQRFSSERGCETSASHMLITGVNCSSDRVLIGGR